MPVILVIILFPLIILAWVARFVMYRAMRDTTSQNELRMWEAIAKHQREARMARPLKDYVASLKPEPVKKIALRLPPPLPVAPTLGNIGRFAALSINSHSEQYYVRDEQGEVYGPADETAIRDWIREQRIGPDTPVSNSAQGPWLPASQIRALRDSFKDTVRTSAANRFDNLKLG